MLISLKYQNCFHLNIYQHAYFHASELSIKSFKIVKPVLYCFRVFPESPRWLYSQGKLKESEKVILKAAQVNKVQLPEGFFEKVFGGQQEVVHVGRVWHLFSSKTLAIRTSILYFNW